MTSVSNLIHNLYNSHDLEGEYNILREFKEILTEKDSTDYFFSHSEILNEFVVYIFNRRFGWSDFEKTQQDGNPLLKNGSSSFEIGNKIKKQINDLTDEFLHFLREQPIATSILDALLLCIAKASSKPVVRKQTFHHLFDWLQLQIADMQTSLSLIHFNFPKIQVLYK